MADQEKKAALFDQLARVGKALGNGKRLELLDLLAQSERSVEALATACGTGLTTDRKSVV
jgi:DNA-binding transcriptional ArsR family regulator